MKNGGIFKIQFNKIDWLVFLTFLVVSVTIFGYYLTQNAHVNYADERAYFSIGKEISQVGLYEIENSNILGQLDVRTYLYPAIIGFFFSLTNGDIFYTKIFVSILQYSVYFFTILLTANTVSKPKDKLVWHSIIGFGFLNPYLISSTTLFLTDILSACFIIISVLLLTRVDFNKIRNLSLCFGLLYSAIMIRPSSIIFIPILIGFSLYRIIKKKDLKISKLFLVSSILLVIFIPQLYINIVYFDDWNPLIHRELYDRQSKFSVSLLKYGTVMMPDEKFQLYYYSDVVRAWPSRISIFDLSISDPLSFLYVYSVHIFGVLDWSYVDTYIKNFYPLERIPASIFLYTGWFVIFTGIFTYRKKRTNLKNDLLFYTLIFSVILYVLFIATTAVESRFGYPIYLLLLPFSGFGIKQIYNLYSKSNSKISLIINGLKLYPLYASFILVFFYLSFWLDSQTGRIDWFDFLNL